MKTLDKENISNLESLKSFTLVNEKNYSNRLTSILTALILVTILCLIFIPWQQSVIGVGKVSVFSPMERPQTIESQIPGRIIKWHFKEGDYVKEGEVLLEIQDIDPKFLDPEILKRMNLQKQSIETQRIASVAAAKERIIRAEQRKLSAEQDLIASKKNLETADLNLTRLTELNKKGLRSNRDLELAILDQTKAKSDFLSKEASLEASDRDLTISKYDLQKVNAETDQNVLKLDIELNNIKTRIIQRSIKAPLKGQLVRIIKPGAGQTVNASEELCIIAPETKDQAVELFISDFDAPLVSLGRKVRLQFAGWPALQFTGWPSIAVGTFGGVISVIDAVDDGRSRYRLLIKPDLELIKNGKDEPWPLSKHLRPGTEVIGWVQLDTVPLGYELWRQFNAFPPTIQREVIQTEGKLKLETRTSKKAVKQQQNTENENEK